MENGTTLDRVRKLISETCAVDPSTVSENARLRGYGIDSVSVMELIFSLEDEFQVGLEQERLENISTVRELADYIDSLNVLKS